MALGSAVVDKRADSIRGSKLARTALREPDLLLTGSARVREHYQSFTSSAYLARACLIKAKRPILCHFYRGPCRSAGSFGECRRVWVNSKLPRPARRPRRMSEDRAVTILGLLCEGASIRAIQRLTGAEQRTILRVLTDLGEGCARLLEELIQGVTVTDVEIDEIWTCVYCEKPPAAGLAIAICSWESRGTRKSSWLATLGSEPLKTRAPSWHGWAHATEGRFHLSSDGFESYPAAVDEHLGARVDYG